MRMAYFLFLGVAGGALSALALSSVSLSLFDWAAKAVAAEQRPTPGLFTEIYQVVHERYVTLPDDSKLIEGAIKGLVGGSILILSIWMRRAFELFKRRRGACLEA